MRVTGTLNQYIAKRYVINFIFLLTALLAVIYLFDTVELIRRASKHSGVPLSLILQMGLLKLPEVGQTLFPFAILFSAMYTFWQLTRRYELIVARASGFSIWQLLTPITLVALLIGLMQMMVINPVGAIFISKFEDLERIHLKRQENQIAIFQEGLWLRQPILIEPESSPNGAASPDGSEQTENNLIKGYIIFYAQKVKQPEWILKNVTALYFTDQDKFLQRIDARTATLGDHSWTLKDVKINKNHKLPLRQESHILPTTLTVTEIVESFSSPESMSFWKLPSYIRTLEQTGFDATALKVYYHNLLAQPLMFVAMILLAATVSMRPPRSQGGFLMIFAGVFVGFIVFFLSSFLQALGATQQIPVIMAAWSPALIPFLLGLSMMMNMEDG